ncbi:MAG: peptidase M23 family protein [Parcubacteria group bacterium LiPW_30]|nr:MAG: peptidase M23 family protein [Parcubacteria group bacterium LiPW_30]
MFNFTSKIQKVIAINDLNVRIGEPSTTASSSPFPKGTIFDVIGFISNGDTVRENSVWYKCDNGSYLWSGNVKVIDDVQKILTSPLPYLVCTQKFGERPEVYKNYGSPKGHNGLDFRTWVNNDPHNFKQDVFSVLDGKVTEADFDQVFKGNFIRIKHEKYESIYLHLSRLDVKSGDLVKAGQQIGKAGNTGSVSEAPHLHFGVRPINFDKNNGYMGYIDPSLLFVDEIKYV